MFERRLKIFLGILVLVTMVLVLRAAQVQVIQKDDWQAKALEQMKRSRQIATIRGSIIDHKKREIAVDRPCIDVCVDFRALSSPPDEKWVRDVAIERLRNRLRDAFKDAPKSKRTQMVADEVKAVHADIGSMWSRLSEIVARAKDPLATALQIAQVREQVEQTRDQVVKKVTMRRRYVWYRNYQLAVKKYEEREPAPAWRRWLIDESAEAPTPEQFTNMTVAEELDDHPILKAVTTEVQNQILKRIEDYPGLVLRAGVQRYYPYGEAGCHLIGQLSRVTAADLDADPNVGKDELRQYYPNDLIGRTGLERLAEPLLRGSRGRIITVEGRDDEVGRVPFTPGKNVESTIDIELQHDITQMFRYAKVVNEPATAAQGPGGKTVYDTVAMHGGAVVIDISTGEVRALVSAPTFDLNEFDEKYAELAGDAINQPLWNRATQQALTPGSTVKPVSGLAGIAEGKIGPREGIECTGFLVLNGRKYPNGRCWTQSMFGQGMHHQIPYQDPHVGMYGNATGFLTFSDAVQRSCNVYFETLGDRLKMEGLSKWYLKFGLGRKTGIGLPESTGSVPTSYRGPADEKRFATWISAIGQGTTTATPLQMANVAATIGRGGTWVRPRLIPASEGLPSPATPEMGPDVVDLGLPPDAVAQARDGMTRVVNTYAGSAYKIVRRNDIVIAGKTGTAEVGAKLRVKVIDERTGKQAVGDDRKPKYRYLEPSSPHHPNPEAPWYRGFGEDGAKLKHSWFIGFAPADRPTIAFAVAVEYGGSGGTGAGLIAKNIVSALIERQYLTREVPNAEKAQPAAAHEEATELLEHHVGD